MHYIATHYQQGCLITSNSNWVTQRIEELDGKASLEMVRTGTSAGS
jgi:hypothetical protein